MFVPIIMGSSKDLATGRAIAESLQFFGIDSELRVASAHKAVPYLLEMLKSFEADGRPKVYVTVAGRSNALSGVVDANVHAPVIACPPYSDRFGGADVFSSLRLPSGVAPAVVLVPEAAALLAAKMLSLTNPSLRDKIAALQKENVDVVIESDERIRTGVRG